MPRPPKPKLRLSALSGLAAALALLAPAAASAQDANALARLVAERPANEGRTGAMLFELTNAKGSTRTREALMVHSERNGAERIGIWFTRPARIEETGFLSFDRDGGEDETWLYLPATERVRRLPSSDRGDYFMGTDLTYGDIQDNFKFELSEWDFASAGQAEVRGKTLPLVRATAKSPAVAAETGYGGFTAAIDPATAFPVQIRYTDPEGEPLKVVDVLEIEEIGGAQTAIRFSAENLQSGHRTMIRFEGMRHVPDLDESLFDAQALAYGLPDIG